MKYMNILLYMKSSGNPKCFITLVPNYSSHFEQISLIWKWHLLESYSGRTYVRIYS